MCVCVCVLWFPILSVCVLSARQRGGFRQRNGERIRGEDKKNQGLVWDCSSSFSLIDGVGGEGKEAFLCLFSFLSVRPLDARGFKIWPGPLRSPFPCSGIVSETIERSLDIAILSSRSPSPSPVRYRYSYGQGSLFRLDIIFSTVYSSDGGADCSSP